MLLLVDIIAKANEAGGAVNIYAYKAVTAAPTI
jgi:hypothetical protein